MHVAAAEERVPPPTATPTPPKAPSLDQPGTMRTSRPSPAKRRHLTGAVDESSDHHNTVHQGERGREGGREQTVYVCVSHCIVYWFTHSELYNNCFFLSSLQTPHLPLPLNCTIVTTITSHPLPLSPLTLTPPRPHLLPQFPRIPALSTHHQPQWPLHLAPVMSSPQSLRHLFLHLKSSSRPLQALTSWG